MHKTSIMTLNFPNTPPFDSDLIAMHFSSPPRHHQTPQQSADLSQDCSFELNELPAFFDLCSSANAAVTTTTTTTTTAKTTTTTPGQPPALSEMTCDSKLMSTSLSMTTNSRMDGFPTYSGLADGSAQGDAHQFHSFSVSSCDLNNLALQDSAKDLSQFVMPANSFAPTSQVQFCPNNNYQGSDGQSDVATAPYMLFNPSSYMPLPNAQLPQDVLSQIQSMPTDENSVYHQGYDSGFSSPPTLRMRKGSQFTPPHEELYQVANVTSRQAPAVRRKKSGRPRLHPVQPSGPNQEMVCPYPACGKTFYRFHNLKSHLIVHTEGKPFKCSQCELSFRRNHDLRRHERMHKGLRPFSCSKCNKSFCRSDALKRHIKVDACGEYNAALALNLQYTVEPHSEHHLHQLMESH